MWYIHGVYVVYVWYIQYVCVSTEYMPFLNTVSMHRYICVREST